MNPPSLTVDELVQIYKMIPQDGANSITGIDFIAKDTRKLLTTKYTVLELHKVCDRIKSNFEIFSKMCKDYEKSKNAKQNIVFTKIGESLVNMFCYNQKKNDIKMNIKATKEKEKQSNEGTDSYLFVTSANVDIASYSFKKAKITNIVLQGRYKHLDLNAVKMIPKKLCNEFCIMDGIKFQGEEGAFAQLFKEIVSKQTSDICMNEVFKSRISVEPLVAEYRATLKSYAEKYKKTEEEMCKIYNETCGNLRDVEKVCKGLDTNRWNYLEDLVLTNKEESKYSLLLKMKGEQEIKKRKAFLGIK